MTFHGLENDILNLLRGHPKKALDGVANGVIIAANLNGRNGIDRDRHTLDVVGRFNAQRDRHDVQREVINALDNRDTNGRSATNNAIADHALLAGLRIFQQTPAAGKDGDRVRSNFNDIAVDDDRQHRDQGDNNAQNGKNLNDAVHDLGLL